MNAALQFATDHADDAVDQLKDWLRIPSISTDPARNADTRRVGTHIYTPRSVV